MPLFTALLLLVSCVKHVSTGITIKGSDTVLPISQKVAEMYMKLHPDESITVVGGGSSVGFASFEEGHADIVQSSRAIKLKEKIVLNDSKINYEQQIIAYDALAIVVNKQNKVNHLSLEQLKQIYLGEITNWKEVGGDDRRIVTYARESSSGTYSFFKELILKNKEYSRNTLYLPASAAVIEATEETKGAIGFVGLAYLGDNIKSLAIAKNDTAKSLLPSKASVKNGDYPILRPLFYYYSTKNKEKINPFIEFVLSPEGQKAIEQLAYIPFEPVL